jgi:hypothetical protein
MATGKTQLKRILRKSVVFFIIAIAAMMRIVNHDEI